MDVTLVIQFVVKHYTYTDWATLAGCSSLLIEAKAVVLWYLCSAQILGSIFQ
jgi:hypothetical protein